MRKALYTALIVVVVFAFAVSSALAGDKVRGEKGQGSVNQVQVQDPPPFQP